MNLMTTIKRVYSRFSSFETLSVPNLSPIIFSQIPHKIDVELPSTLIMGVESLLCYLFPIWARHWVTRVVVRPLHVRPSMSNPYQFSESTSYWQWWWHFTPIITILDPPFVMYTNVSRNFCISIIHLRLSVSSM